MSQRKGPTLNRHYVYVREVLHHRYEVDLPEGDPFTQVKTAREAVRDLRAAGDAGQTFKVQERIVWDFATGAPGG